MPLNCGLGFLSKLIGVLGVLGCLMAKISKKIPSNFMEFIKFKGTAKHEKI